MKRAQGSPEEAIETRQRRDSDSSIMAESESQLELQDETDMADQECCKGQRTVDRVHVLQYSGVCMAKLYVPSLCL